MLQGNSGCFRAGREGKRCAGVLASERVLHSAFLSPQGGLGLFVQLMPILILIIVSALSQMMVSSPPYSLSQRPLVPLALSLSPRGGCWGAGRSASPGVSVLYLLLLPGVSHLREGQIVSRQLLGWKGLSEGARWPDGLGL